METSERASATPAKLELANQLFQEYYAACFWHLKPDLQVTEALLPLIIRGLRTYGGRLSALAAAPVRGMNGSSRICP